MTPHPTQVSSRFVRLTSLIFFLLCLALLLANPAFARADAELSGTKPAQWRLTWKDDPSTKATLSWSTAELGKTHKVLYREADAEEQQAVECHRNGAFTDKRADEPLYYHHALLTDLKPATKYFVQMVSDENQSPEFYFITAPDDDRPLEILFGGDSRSDQKSRRAMNEMLAEMLSKRKELIAFAHGGDYIVSGSKLSLWKMWMSDHELTTTADGRLLPVIPARGNHDGGPIYNEVFDFPEGDTNYFAIDLGSQIRFVTLNTEISTAGDQAGWLAEELSASRPKYRWLLAQYHRPAFPAVKNPSGARRDWVPIFEKYNLDVACEADGHNIKRTPPIRNDKLDRTGVVYIGEGGLGVGQRTPLVDDPKRWYLRSPGLAGKGHHIQVLHFNQERIHYSVVLLGGELFDEYDFPVRTAVK